MFRRSVVPSIAGVASFSRSKASVSPAVATVVPTSGTPVIEDQQQPGMDKKNRPTFAQLTSLRLLHSLLSKEVAPTWDQFSAAAAKKYPHLNLVGLRSTLQTTGVNFLAPQEQQKLLDQLTKTKQREADLVAKRKAEEAAREHAAKIFQQTLDARVLYTDLVRVRGGVEPTWRQFAAEVEKQHGIRVGSDLMRQLQSVPGIVFLTKEKAKALYAQEIEKMEEKHAAESEQLQSNFLKERSNLMLRQSAERRGIDNRHKKIMETLKEEAHPTLVLPPRYVRSIQYEQGRELAKIALSNAPQGNKTAPKKTVTKKTKKTTKKGASKRK